MDFRSIILKMLRSTSQNGVSERVLELFEEYYNLTLKWAEKINITANLSPENFVLENILDPYLCVQSFALSAANLDEKAVIADMGCGGGYVGIVAKLAFFPHQKLYLVDSDRKKINFCKQAVRELGLEPVEAICTRIEGFQPDESLDLVFSRATWGAQQAFEYVSPLLSQEGSLLYLTGKKEHLIGDYAGGSYEIPVKNAVRYYEIIKKGDQ